MLGFVGDTLPNKLAEGATIGLPNCLIIADGHRILGIRIPTLFSSTGYC